MGMKCDLSLRMFENKVRKKKSVTKSRMAKLTTRLAGHIACIEENENLKARPLRRPRHRLEDSIEIYVYERKWDSCGKRE
jgi:hypothetical protein